MLKAQERSSCARAETSHAVERLRRTVRKHIVVRQRGRGKDARQLVRVQPLLVDPLPAAVDPRSSPHRGRRALHLLSSQAARLHRGLQAAWHVQF